MSIGPEERRPPMTPQLALRVAIVSSVALGMFAIIFFRLWFLQVLSGDQYLAKANTNRTRDIAVAAPRGKILDRSGQVLVDSVQELAVELSPPDLPTPVTPANIASPPSRDVAVYDRLARVLRLSTRPSHCAYDTFVGYNLTKEDRLLSPVACQVAKQVGLVPYGNVTVKTGVSDAVQFYIAERQSHFRGVLVERQWVTHYPLHSLAGQVLGTVGPINSTEINQKAYAGIPHDAIIGQSGLEAAYNRYLLGTPGSERITVNAAGEPTGAVTTHAPLPGENLETSLDVNLQRVGEQSLAQSIASNPGADGGAFVALDPQNGEVLAMGSNPSFDPSIFTRSVISKKAYEAVTSKANNVPELNRAIDSAGPTGSTFKPITATAALQSGKWTTTDTYDDTGKYCFPQTNPPECRHNAGGAVDGTLDLEQAIQVSSDDFFYNLGTLINADPGTHPEGGPLQQWAKGFGIGQPTGIDIPGEMSGTLPTPKWRQWIDHQEVLYERKHHVPCCTLADKRPWSEGDNANLAVGQGDVQVTPLQLAVAYSALANDGTIVRPHIGLNVVNSQGTVLQKINPPAARHISFNQQDWSTILAGLRAAASQPGGTSAQVFGNFPEQVYGKTGTAQYVGQPDYSWYACFVPATATSKPIVVVVTVERGGFGAVAAAPVARQILSQWFFGKPGPYVAGSSKTL
jgi:penicillin-binding protein 2